MDTRLIMGSSSNIGIARKATKMLKKSGLSYEVSVIPAHRALDALKETAEKDDRKVYITIVGKAAHLDGVTTRTTTRPVIGIPVKGSALAGMDALYSVVQMSKGVLVAAVATDGGENAVTLAVQIIALSDEKLAQKLEDYKEEMKQTVIDSDKELEEI